MNNKVSNLFGDVKLNANQYLDFEYNFALDDNFKTLNYNMIKSTFSINNFVTSFEFLEENNTMGSTSWYYPLYYFLPKTQKKLQNC